jgi:hypothetical protein
MTAKTILVETAPGELIDKITILELKRQHVRDAEKLANVEYELRVLTTTLHKAVVGSPQLDRLTAELKAVNARLWQIEDDIRDCESRQDFGARFIQLARAVYHENDRRVALKRQINVSLGSAIVEEKLYKEYASAPKKLSA